MISKIFGYGVDKTDPAERGLPPKFEACVKSIFA
jgi:hypothetical protein